MKPTPKYICADCVNDVHGCRDVVICDCLTCLRAEVSTLKMELRVANGAQREWIQRAEKAEGKLARKDDVLREAKRWLEHEAPPEPDHSCGPYSDSCDGECVNYAHHVRFMREIDAALSGTPGGGK